MKKRVNEAKFRFAMRLAEGMSNSVLAFFVSEAVLRYETAMHEAGWPEYSEERMWDLVDFLLPVPPEKEKAVE